MSWEAAAHDEAKRQDHADSDWYAREATWLFMDGARWQRDQLRTDEALEPWARAIYAAATAKDPFPHSWETADEFARGAAYSRARGIMNALLGEET